MAHPPSVTTGAIPRECSVIPKKIESVATLLGIGTNVLTDWAVLSVRFSPGARSCRQKLHVIPTMRFARYSVGPTVPRTRKGT